MIAPMKRVLLGGRACDRKEILAALQDAGIIHVEPVRPETVRVSPELIEETENVARAIDLLSALEPSESQIPPPGTPSRLVDELRADMVLLARLESDKLFLTAEIERVSPWGHIDRGDIAALRAVGLHVEFLTCPEGQEDSVKADLKQLIANRKGDSFILAVSRTAVTAEAPALRISGLEKDSYDLTAALTTVTEKEKRIKENFHEIAKRLDEIREFHNELTERRRFIEVESGLANEGEIFVLKGWIPADSCEAIEQAFEKSRLPVALQFTDPPDDEVPPTKFKNSWWCRPVESLFPLLGVIPGYREADISPTFFPFLIVFTAFLVGDAGYGLVAVISMAVAFRPLITRGVPRPILELFMALFGGVLIFGILTNTYFGEAPAFLNLTGFNGSTPQGMEFLKWLCFFIGAVHLTLAHLWKIRRVPMGLPVVGEVGWVLFIWPMFALVNVLVLGYKAPFWMIPGFVISLGLVVFFTAPSTNVLSMVGQGLGAVALNAAAFLSDIISYIRLWAIGLAGGILAATFNQLAKPLPLVIMVLVLAAAHFMNFALGLIAIFAHGVRLNLLEFSNHLGMEWSGRPFEPFKKKR